MSQSETEEHPQQQPQQQSDITSLQENFSKQQEKISALKELVRKSEAAHGKSTSSAQEKVKNIALRLTNLKSKARSRQNLDSSSTSLNDAQFQSQENVHLLQSQCSTTIDAGGGDPSITPRRPSAARIETPGSEKILLLRKQMEENKAKMAEREHSKREIEHMVTQLKAKFDTTQQHLEHSSELGRSMGDLSALSYSSVRDKVRSATDLSSAPFNLDKERIKFLDNRVRLLEKQLEKEKSSSDASKRVKELENKILELEEGLKEKRTRELVATLNDHDVEESWQIENDRLKTELEEKARRILHLEEVNDILETAKCDLTEKAQELEARLRESEHRSKAFEEELEKLKASVDSQKFELVDDVNVDRQVEQELTLQVQQLEIKIKKLEQENDEIREENETVQQENKEKAVSESGDRTESLEATIESQREDIQKHLERIKTLEEELMEKTIELNVLNANFAVLEEKLKVPSRKPLFATTSDADIGTLKDELEDTKKKSKHLEKQLIEFKRLSDLHATVAELTEENEDLQQKITELEDEKGQLQLKLVSGERTTIVTEIEIEKKIEYLEATCQNQNSAIQLLEEQKMDMTENLQSTKSELESARVVSEMESIQLEEQVTTNLQKIEELLKENTNLCKTVQELRGEKCSLTKKMEHYVAENMELLDKIEKLSKSSSSAESIEIVERLTQQDRLEIEAFNKRIEQEEARLLTEGTSGHQEMDQELSDSLVKLKEESSELMHKIELFTTERKEVLEKMETLRADNHEHLKRIEQLTDEKAALERSNDEANIERETLRQKVKDANEEKETIRKEINEISAEKNKITAELNSMIKAASVSVPSDAKDLLDKCEKSLAKLNTELESYRKANDKNAKFTASKKLSKEAKNAHQQLTELLEKVKGASAAPAIVSPADDAKIEELQSVIAHLRQDLTNASTASEEKDTQIARLNEEITSLRSMSEEFDGLINDKEMAHEKQIESLTRLRRELEAKIETTEAEMKILQELITEQKQQLIEAYTDSETEIAKKVDELNKRDKEIFQLKNELKTLQEKSGHVGQQFSNDLQLEVDKLKEALSINKGLLAEQIDELSNKQETIDILNVQIMELYKTMEENANKVIEKEDEIAYVQDQLNVNKGELEKLTKENEENKKVVDKLLLELHSHKGNLERLSQLPVLEEDNLKLREENQTLEENLQIAELNSSQLEQTVKDLEHRNKDQLEKLKKYAANLKKKVAQCQEFEAKIKNLEKGAIDAETKEKNPLMETLQEEVREKTAQLNKLSLELESMQAAANQQRNYLEQSVLKVQEALDGVQFEVMTLREQLHEKTTHVEELTLALNENNKTLNESTNQLNVSKMKIQELNVRSQLQSSSQEELIGLQTLLNEKNATIDKLNEQILDAVTYQDDLLVLREQLNEKNTAISELNAQVCALIEQNTLNNQMLSDLTSIREELNTKDKEILKQNKILDGTEELLTSLQEELSQKNAEIQLLNEQLKQAQTSSGQSLVSQDELKEKNTKIEELTKEFKAKSLKFEKSKAVIKEKNREIQRLNQLLSKQVEEEQIVPTTAPKVVMSVPPSSKVLAEVEELRKENNKLRDESATERANFQETISRLETLHDGIQAKLQEDMSYIETLEHENNNFKEKICRLEECVATFEDRRASMERRANLLDAQLQTRVDEHAKAEDELVYRLNMLSDHDDIIGLRLFEAQEENELLSSRLDALKTEHATLVTNYAKLEKEYSTFQEETSNNMDTENHSLKTQLAAIDAEAKRLRSTYEAKLAAKHSEIDELENDLSEQLRVIGDEKRSLSEELERAKDELIELKDEQVRLNETINSLEQVKTDLERESTWIKMQNENLSQDQFELQELRMQSMQDKTELENVKHQIDTLVQNHEIELNALRTQIAELDSMRMQVGQNQTDDQVFIETENKRLTDLLAEKEAVIENYQRQNLQLQMNALAARQQPADPFASLTQSDDSAQVANLRDKCDRLERELNEKQREIDHLRVTEQQQQMVVPPPVAFFGAEQSAPSVFDEIVSIRNVENLHGAVHSRAPISHPSLVEEPADNQQTIEDLQRNVSDLEKHANDLENKLSHRIAAHEDSQRQLEELRQLFEARLREYEERIRELELKKTTKAIDSQIIPTEQLPSLDMFFRGAPEASPFESIIIPQVSTEPVIEEVIVPKKAYTCQPDQLELDEGWGWGSEEAALEAKHFAATSSASLIPPQQQLELKLQEKLERIQELELERDRLEQQKQEMQVKSGKLMKKLKEYKTKIEELNSQAAFRKSSSVESSSDLDLAIQEEMKSQLKQLEEKLAEAKKQTDGQALEKENLLKRIDVLTAGNERMAEMKERQDNDVQMYKSRIRELTEKLKNLEDWSGSAEVPPTTPETAVAIPAATEELEKTNRLLEKKVQELLSENDDIVGDRIELQALLDEERANAASADQTIRVLNEKITRLENSLGSDSADQKFQLNELKLQNQNLQSELTDAQEAVAREKHERLEEINRLATQSEELCREIAKLQIDSVKAKELEIKLSQVSAEKHDLIKEIEALRMELTFVPQTGDATAELEKQVVRLSSDLESVVMQNQDLGKEVDRLRKETKPSEDVNRLSIEVNRLTSELRSINDKNQQLEQEISQVRLEYSFALRDDDKSNQFTSEINRLQLELQSVNGKNQQLVQEINNLRLGQSFAPRDDNLTSELKILESQLQSVNAKNQQLEQEINGFRLQQSFASRDDDKSIHLTSEVNRLQLELQSVNDKNNQLTQEINNLRLGQPFALRDDHTTSEVNRLELELQSVKQRNEELSAEISRVHLESAFSSKPGGNFVELERLSAEMNRLTNDLQSVNAKNEELSKEVERLRLEPSSNEKSAQLESEINRLVMENKSLTTQIGRLQLESSASTQQTDLEEQNQEKDSEIMHLKQRIEDLMREDQTEKLVIEILTKNQEIHLLKMQVKNLEDDKQELEHNLTLQITQELNLKRGDVVDSSEKLQQLQAELEAMRTEKAHMEEELQVLNNHVMSSLENEEKMKTAVLELDMKNIEIAELRKSLQTVKSQESAPAVADLSSVNTQWEAIVEQRCSEIATMWRQHLDNREAEFKEIKDRLQHEIDALKTDRSSPSQQSNPDEDHSSASSSKETSPADSDLIQKMQQALESQEMEIVTLKEQLAIRSAEYARLAAQYDPYKMQSTMSHSSGFSSDGQRRSETSTASSVVPKSELDLALYMLHQRDMRCEELTLELVHLLEERDTLQLKLSNTLRQVEDIKTQTGAVVESPKGDSTSPPESPKKVQPHTTTPTTDTDDLHQKLSQLQSVSHSKDKRFQEERDQRIRQMEKIQQDVAKMPSEALSDLVGSDLSQSNQSPSSVLLNWLWGKPSGGQS